VQVEMKIKKYENERSESLRQILMRTKMNYFNIRLKKQVCERNNAKSRRGRGCMRERGESEGECKSVGEGRVNARV